MARQGRTRVARPRRRQQGLPLPVGHTYIQKVDAKRMRSLVEDDAGDGGQQAGQEVGITCYYNGNRLTHTWQHEAGRNSKSILLGSTLMRSIQPSSFDFNAPIAMLSRAESWPGTVPFGVR